MDHLINNSQIHVTRQAYCRISVAPRLSIFVDDHKLPDNDPILMLKSGVLDFIIRLLSFRKIYMRTVNVSDRSPSTRANYVAYDLSAFSITILRHVRSYFDPQSEMSHCLVFVEYSCGSLVWEKNVEKLLKTRNLWWFVEKINIYLTNITVMCEIWHIKYLKMSQTKLACNLVNCIQIFNLFNGIFFSDWNYALRK